MAIDPILGFSIIDLSSVEQDGKVSSATIYDEEGTTRRGELTFSFLGFTKREVNKNLVSSSVGYKGLILEFKTAKNIPAGASPYLYLKYDKDNLQGKPRSEVLADNTVITFNEEFRFPYATTDCTADVIVYDDKKMARDPILGEFEFEIHSMPENSNFILKLKNPKDSSAKPIELECILTYDRTSSDLAVVSK